MLLVLLLLVVVVLLPSNSCDYYQGVGSSHWPAPFMPTGKVEPVAVPEGVVPGVGGYLQSGIKASELFQKMIERGVEHEAMGMIG